MSAQGEVNGPPGRARFTRLLDELRSIAVRHLGMLSNGVFESASDTLLEFAAKAENNAVQALFFEATQGIGRGRQNLQRAFEGEIKIGFAQFFKGQPLAVAGEAEAAADAGKQKVAIGFTSSLRLLDKLAHEESAVIQTLAAKSSNRYLEALYALSQRLSIVNGGKRLEEAALPAGPIHILNAFNASVRPLRLAPNVKLVLYAVFDRVVMTELESLYEELNLCLINAGVLPNLRPSVAKTGSNSGPARDVERAQERQQPAAKSGQKSAGGDDSAEPSMGDQVFNDIRELMVSCRQTERAAAGPPVEQYTDNTMLVSAISQMQSAHALPSAAFDPAQTQPERVDRGVLEAIRSHLQEQRQLIYKGVDRRRIPQIEVDVIDVVGMLFDCILNDEVLANSVKALLSRLHTPYLKIAVLDKRMFSSEKHPARLLLNIMAEAGAKWVSQDHLQAGIYPQMVYIVERVLNEFQGGLQIFEDLIEEFSASVEVLKQKAELSEQRAREAATGQEKLQLARERAQQELAARMIGKQLPVIARKFLVEIWADHLMLMVLRSRGADSSQDFVEALRIADEIIWSVTPKHTPEEREQLSLRLPKLQQIIEDELGTLGGYSRDEQGDLYSLLKDLQTNALRGEQEVGLAAAVVPVVETAVVAQPGKSSPEPIPAEDQAIIDTLRKLNFGALFDFVINPAGDTRRLKLSWFSHVTANYMFVDQTGVKAAVYNIRDLARAMREGKAHIVEEHNKPFFEWALESIRNVLKASAKS